MRIYNLKRYLVPEDKIRFFKGYNPQFYFKRKEEQP